MPLKFISQLYLQIVLAVSSKVPETTRTVLRYHGNLGTWNEAASYCNDLGGVLGNIENDVKDSALMESFRLVAENIRNQSEDIWIGLHATNSWLFQWSTCNGLQSSIQKWGRNSSDAKDSGCIALNTTSNLLSIRVCSERKPFFCEIYTECGCKMTPLKDKCINVTESQYKNASTQTLKRCQDLCLQYVSGGEQCWSISFNENLQLCQIHEIPTGYITCPDQSFQTYYKNCFGVSTDKENIFAVTNNTHATGPQVNCTLAAALTDFKKPCNITNMTVTTVVSTEKTCVCSCSTNADTDLLKGNMTLDQQLVWLRTTLLIDKKKTNLVIRSKMSASDTRFSAQGIGYAGVVILVISIAGVVCLDLTRLAKDMTTAVKLCQRWMSRATRKYARNKETDNKHNQRMT